MRSLEEEARQNEAERGTVSRKRSERGGVVREDE